ncbi:MAG: hypothetical protein M0R73_08625 [Dehalococcoidia bacterium]|nr:hypothetical protein [Dehalococcoidia bacterium]
MASTLAPTAPRTASPEHLATPDGAEATRRRYRREASMGERCPHCAGPLVFGEGCHVCPICGYSACGV